MTVTDSINLAAECGALPGGGELAGYSGYQGNLILTVEGSLSFQDGIRWSIRIDKPTTTATGRKGKPRHVLSLRANDGEGVPELLRSIADAWEQGDVEIGEPE